MISRMRDFLSDRRGHTAIEYSMIIGVGAIAIVVSLQFMGETTMNTFDHLLTAWGAGSGN